MTTTHTDTEAKQKALAAFLECDPGELSEETLGSYGLTVFSLGNKEYAVGTDAEADEACADYIRESAWAFNASFILGECGLPLEMEDAIRSFQEKECEGANDAILALIHKCGNFDSFVQEAIAADGRGHFLSSYDGNENEAGEFFVYRTN